MSIGSLYEEIAESRFYDEWAERFETEWRSYIRPSDPKVEKWSGIAVRGDKMSDEEKAERVWMYVYNNVEYDLSEKWKSPRETINSRKGDCEDVTFLIASMLPNVGVEKSYVVLGSLKINGEKEYHTWNKVGDMVIDGTGGKDAVKSQTYTPEKKWEILVE